MFVSKFTKLKNFRRLFCNSVSPKRLRILGIETSCDDTGIAVVDSDRNILGEAKYSQSEIHAMHGGILPQLAKALHEDNIRKATSEALEKSQLSIKDLDAIAVTVKPGIPGSLEVGIEYAKDLCTLYSKPLIPIHHMEAHALTVRLLEDVDFPFLVLLTSGGHCILAIAESVTKFSVLGETGDITPGIFFDKAARRLNLRNIKEFILMQGGAAIEIAARKGNPFQLELPFISKRQRDCNFTFSGYQTAVLTYLEAQEKKLNIMANGLLPNVYDICATVQFELFKYICERLQIGMKFLNSTNILGEKRVLVVSGGVASNEYFRKMLRHVCDYCEYDLMIPPKNLCTDNGVMIAWNGIERLRENVPVVLTSKLDSVQLIQKCPLGENISEDVKSFAWKGNYIKLKRLMRAEMEKELKDILAVPQHEVKLAR